jgi:hypothetical protein
LSQKRAVRKLNPSHGKSELRDTEENIRLLIKQKEKLYPKIEVQILGAQIQNINGKDIVTVASIR